MKYALILPLLILSICEILYADTILLKDGQELKGVIVEDYYDRIVLSTEKGEIGLSKKNIEKISYETPVENLVKLGAFYKDKGEYKTALYYYEAAYKLDPNIKEAQEGTLLVTNMMFRKRESDLEKEVALRQDTEEKMGKPQTGEPSKADPSEAEKIELWNSVGISLGTTGPDIKVGKVLEKSPADEAGIQPQDIIVSIWGKLIKYMPPEEAYNLFLRGSVRELRLMVSRPKSIPLGKNHIFGGAEKKIGGRLTMEFEGLTVSEVETGGPLENAGILKGDRITRLGGVSTRYMPLESAYRLIENIEDNSLDLEIQREVTFWRR